MLNQEVHSVTPGVTYRDKEVGGEIEKKAIQEGRKDGLVTSLRIQTDFMHPREYRNVHI